MLFLRYPQLLLAVKLVNFVVGAETGNLYPQTAGGVRQHAGADHYNFYIIWLNIQLRFL